MRVRSVAWHEEHDLEERRRVRNATYVSLAIHASLVAALVISPPTSFAPMPQTIAVELVAGPQLAAPAAPRSSGRPKPPPPAPEPPAEQAAPEPPPEPAPPMPKAPVQVLPENAPRPEKKQVKQAPEKKPREVAKAETKPRPAEKPAKKQPDKSLSYEDAMKSLDEELGEDATEDLLAPAPPRPGQQAVAESSGQAESRAGAVVDPELAAWNLATQRRIQSKWVTPATFRDRGLATVMELRLSASGDLIGEPVVVRTSGDPYFDDNAVRAVLSVAPLPPPPEAGKRIFIFRSEAN